MIRGPIAVCKSESKTNHRGPVTLSAAKCPRAKHSTTQSSHSVTGHERLLIQTGFAKGFFNRQNDALGRGVRATTKSVRNSTPLITAIFAILATFVLLPAPGMAHAELVRADPPVDGLAISSPDRITLTFSEPVTTTAPAPVVSILNEHGEYIGESPLPILTSDVPRTLMLEIPDLERGTYTVTWETTAATDGHSLSGVYAFRVGGGLPPGLATSANDLPAPWAVATRWLTFLGASLAAGLLLFSEAFVVKIREGSRWRSWRGRLILGGAALALSATVAEPLIQWLVGDSSLRTLIDALPDGWWWRPTLLLPLTLLGLAVAWPMRGALPRPIALAGATLALGSLLGLIMTSHAAGRANDRLAAIASNALHQWTVALWTGGVASLVVWTITRSRADDAPALRIRRFSNAALGLFVAAVATGFVNAGFIFPFVTEVRANGFQTSVFDPLWTSNYGVVLLIKVAILLMPLTLAIYHRQTVVRLGLHARSTVGEVAGKMPRTLRWELIAIAAVIVGGSTIALSAPPSTVEVPLEQITLVAAASEVVEPDSILVHLTIDPADSGENAITARLTDGDGVELAEASVLRFALDFTSLEHGTVNPGVSLQRSGGGSNVFQTAGLDLSLEGWWQIDARFTLTGENEQVATFYSLLPDPNTQGSDAAPKSPSDPDAEALFETAYGQMLGWDRVRWTERLGSGNDALVVASFAVVDGGEDEPDAHTLNLEYSGGFGATVSGIPPQPPTYDSRASITIGDKGWLETGSGVWLDQPPSSFSTPSEWDTIYSGSEHHRMGAIQVIDGVEHQVVAFYLPTQQGRSEAWVVWWIETSSGNVHQVAMIARLHYMVWNYTDIDGDFTIEPPGPE